MFFIHLRCEGRAGDAPLKPGQRGEVCTTGEGGGKVDGAGLGNLQDTLDGVAKFERIRYAKKHGDLVLLLKVVDDQMIRSKGRNLSPTS